MVMEWYGAEMLKASMSLKGIKLTSQATKDMRYVWTRINESAFEQDVKEA